jgi:Aspartyl/Asparaginyl beta-hydroxylase
MDKGKMMTVEMNCIRTSWQQGIELWYNGCYREAMELWDGAVPERLLLGEWKDDDDSSEDDVEMWTNNKLASGSGDGGADQNNSDLSDLSYLAPLLLFLAGCYLDASEHRKARRCCRQCLQLILSSSSKDLLISSDLMVQTLNEHIAAYEEDPSIKEHWKLSYGLIKWAMDQGCKHFANPYQRAAFCYPLPTLSPAFCERDSDSRPDWCDKLEEYSQEIRDEFWQLYQGSPQNNGKECHDFDQSSWPSVGAASHREGRSAHDASVVQHGGWKELVLLGSGGRPELAPRTSSLVRKFASSAVSLAQAGGGEVIFSVLAPHTRLTPHCASTNIRWTAHLGLTVPSSSYSTREGGQSAGGCRIRVADKWHQWENGKALVFDDSYEHEVLNDTNEIRAVLLLRFWHPNLVTDSERTRALQQALAWKQEDEKRRFHPPPVSPTAY